MRGEDLLIRSSERKGKVRSSKKKGRQRGKRESREVSFVSEGERDRKLDER